MSTKSVFEIVVSKHKCFQMFQMILSKPEPNLIIPIPNRFFEIKTSKMAHFLVLMSRLWFDDEVFSKPNVSSFYVVHHILYKKNLLEVRVEK